MTSPHDITEQFEKAVAAYTGARFVVAATSCTQAILMALAWFKHSGHPNLGWVVMPKKSYLGVPASILNAGFRPMFHDIEWSGEYQLKPFPLWDSARRFTSGMYRPGHMQCTSHHWSKILGLSQAGCILHDNPDADSFLRRARFDGRTEGVDAKVDQVQYPSWHAYLSPEVAAHGLMKLSLLPQHNADLPNSDYPDLSMIKAFK